MDILDELDAGEPAKDEAQAEPQAAEPQAEPQAEAALEPDEPKLTQPRAADGKFARKEADEPVMVPLKALHETRDELKALKAELDQYRGTQHQAEQPQVPDIFENPDGFVQYTNEQLQRAMLNTTLNLSESMAKRYAGADAVEEAKAWGTQAFAGNPVLYQQFLREPDPYGFLIEQHKRASTLAKLGDDPAEFDAFLAWKQSQANAPAQAPAVPDSLASAQSARGSAVPYQPPSLEDLLKG